MRWLLHLKREDLMNPKEQRRMPEGEQQRLVCTDAVIREVTSGGRAVDRAAATGAVAAAAGDVNVAAVNRDGTRELAKQKWDKERGTCNGMWTDEFFLALGDLGDDATLQLRAVGNVKAKSGAMFAASQQINNLLARRRMNLHPILLVNAEICR
jgi:hypothetical protein